PEGRHNMPVSLPSGLFILKFREISFEVNVMLEDILRQIRTILQNQLPNKLDQIEQERADGVSLEDVQSFLIQTFPREGTHLKYPAIYLLGLETTGANAISRRRELRHPISIWVIDRVVSPDSELSQIRLLRYVEAVERILASDPSLGARAIDSVITRHVHLLKEGKDFVRRAILYLEVLERPSTNNY
ncbi:MAG TPA: hypothetical protein ACFYD1_09480, partial [Candidatus Hypogeohydataceae bacterium YC38]